MVVTGQATSTTPSESMASNRSVATLRASPNFVMFAKNLRAKKRWYDLNLETTLGRRLYIFLTIALPMVPLTILTVKISSGLASNAASDFKMMRFVSL